MNMRIGNNQGGGSASVGLNGTESSNAQASNDQATTSAKDLRLGDSSSVATGNEGFVRSDYQKPQNTPGLPDPRIDPRTNPQESARFQEFFIPQNLIAAIQNLKAVPPSASFPEAGKAKVDRPDVIALAKALGISPEEAQEQLQGTAASRFARLIQDLPEDQKNKLMFAYTYPDKGNTLSPELKALLQEIDQKIVQEMGAELKGKGITNWNGITLDQTALTDKAGAEFTTSFEKHLAKMQEDGTLTPEQARRLRTMHYMKEAYANDETLTTLFAQVEGMALNELRAKYGAKADFNPEVDTGYYTQLTNGFFREQYMKSLEAIQPPLTAEEKTQVIGLFNQANGPSEKLNAIAASLTASSIEATQKHFGLTPTWLPSVSTIINPNIDQAQMKMAKDALGTANDMVQHFSAMLESAPDGPTKTAFKTYLQTISMALNKVQEFLYAISSGDAAISKKLSAANLDTVLSDIARAQKQVDEAKAKEKDAKQLDLGPLTQIMSWVGKIVALAVSYMVASALTGMGLGAVGVLLVVLATGYFIDQIGAAATGKTTYTQDMFTAINDKVGNGAWAITGLLACLFSCGNPMFAMSLMTDARTVQEMVRTFGGSKMDQEITAAVFAGVGQLACMAVMMVFTAGAAGPALIAMATEKIAAMTHLSIKTVNMALFVTNMTFTLAMGALQATQQGLRCNWELVQAQIKTILSQSEAASEETKVLVRILRKIIDQLLEALNGHADEIIAISQTSSGIHAKASMEIEGLFQG